MVKRSSTYSPRSVSGSIGTYDGCIYAQHHVRLVIRQCLTSLTPSTHSTADCCYRSAGSACRSLQNPAHGSRPARRRSSVRRLYCAGSSFESTSSQSSGMERRLELTRVPSALRGFLVVTKTEKGRLAELAVRRPLGEGDLGHELRADPGGACLPGRRAERRLVGLKGAHPGGQIRQRLFGKSGADLADVPEGRTVEEADEQRPEVLAVAGGRGETADDELRLLAALHLEPAPRAPSRLVRRGVEIGRAHV